MINKIIKEAVEKAVKEVLWESGLSRIRQHMMEHDTGFITAFRGSLTMDDGDVVKPTREQNIKRNGQLFAVLNRKYDITNVQGRYIEDYGTPKAKEVGESTFFVVNSKDTGTLESDLRSLGEKFQQDSVLFVPKGGSEGIIWGTSKMNPEAWPGYNNSSKLGHPVFGKSGQIMTKLKGRPFLFTEGGTIGEQKKKYYKNWLSELGRQSFIDSDWRKT
ncbi:MAG: hypothetical protein Q8P81_03310 [Nanoarchaeota archaeon]|nr:hypothetical protein [Nanoarchaeota archaeon]